MEQMIVPILLVLCVIFAVLAVLYLILDGKQSRQTVRKAEMPRSVRTSAPERPVKKPRKEQPKRSKSSEPPPNPEPEKLSADAPYPEPENVPAAAPNPEPEKTPAGAPARVLPKKPAETKESSHEHTEKERIDRILSHDPAFAADDFKAYAAACFQRLQAVHRLEDMPTIRGLVGETYYLRKRSDLAMLFPSDDASAPPEETVQSCVIIGDMIRNGKEYLLALLKTSGDTGNVKRYRMVFVRQEGTRTLSEMPLSAFRCPVCGNALSVDIVGICNECGVCVADGSQYWLLEQMESE